jgi:phosphatidylserine decarboxylase
MINKNGYKIIVYNGLLLFGLLILLNFYTSLFLKIITILTSVLLFFHFRFFRDPEREIPQNENLILSPADGSIIKIAEVEENHYLHTKTIMVSIFMSIFDVHVNRVPISGEIEYLNYKSGKFTPAFKDKSSELNEQLIIGIKSPQGKILIKQIAGIIARRIVNNLNKRDMVKMGERFGMIKYCSRVDVFLPSFSKLNVQLNQKMKAGETIIGQLQANRKTI